LKVIYLLVLLMVVAILSELDAELLYNHVVQYDVEFEYKPIRPRTQILSFYLVRAFFVLFHHYVKQLRYLYFLVFILILINDVI